MRKAFKKAFQDVQDLVEGKDDSVSMFYVLSFHFQVDPSTGDKDIPRAGEVPLFDRGRDGMGWAVGTCLHLSLVTVARVDLWHEQGNTANRPS